MVEAKTAEPESVVYDDVPNDVMHLITIASFNGLCQLIFNLAQNSALAPDQLEFIEDCMSAPLDDPDWRDDPSMTSARDVLELVLASAMAKSLGA